ncbi:AMP-binding protein [Actinosynnema sp. NPDC047251]|uniref:AMP-dependent synthetase/ligase domain-containing protein n=1 Tax=Saccharothrix espanaensis (strain ATCC 51144 / DSM 44229 / JCM 9112 / NBRC 15066 / NRRL 15764) TaxID=1179773 RepID=K0JY21_SACES|nr:hypothetical protein BN6_37450 [Saccharothrix espanaensis DSM 44229]
MVHAETALLEVDRRGGRGVARARQSRRALPWYRNGASVACQVDQRLREATPGHLANPSDRRVPRQEDRITYRELRGTSTRMAGALVAAGAPDVVGVLCQNNTAFPQGVLAASRIGAAACPLPLPMGLRDQESYVRRTRRIISTAGLRHLVTVPKVQPGGPVGRNRTLPRPRRPARCRSPGWTPPGWRYFSRRCPKARPSRPVVAT